MSTMGHSEDERGSCVVERQPCVLFFHLRLQPDELLALTTNTSP